MSEAVTKDAVIEAAMAIVRRDGEKSLSFVAIARELESSEDTITALYPSLDVILGIVRHHAWEIYNSYVNAGFQMNPPFKGFATEHIWFAINEPQFYQMLFMNGVQTNNLDEFMEYEGNKEKSIAAIKATFGLGTEESISLYKHLWPVVYGMGCFIATGACSLTVGEASAILGKTCRALLLEQKAGEDKREKYVPEAGKKGPSGDIHSYIDKGYDAVRQHSQEFLLTTLISQNHVLKSIHDNPRYIRDNEWVELDRVLQGAFGISGKALAAMYPNLSAGDIRLITLAKLMFGISASATLLGISPASVTKARQRLKSKLGVDSIEEFVKGI